MTSTTPAFRMLRNMQYRHEFLFGQSYQKTSVKEFAPKLWTLYRNLQHKNPNKPTKQAEEDWRTSNY
uniref:Uncharacterized protein n=1 Tax=Magallana gigas TaxID=29159 RepID=K1QPW8_MAGGI